MQRAILNIDYHAAANPNTYLYTIVKHGVQRLTHLNHIIYAYA